MQILNTEIGIDRLPAILIVAINDVNGPALLTPDGGSKRFCRMRVSRRDDHEIFREQVRRFVEREVVPYHAQWEADGIVPRDVWLKAGRAGLLCCLIPEEYGGAGGDFGHSAVIIEEMARVNASAFGLTTHSEICAPYILRYGTEAQKRRWLTGMSSGETICAIAMTEPGCGSDLRALRTTAVRDGDHYIVNGQKTFISNGVNADLVIVAVKVEPRPSEKKITLLLIDTSSPGFSKGKKLGKVGLRGQDTCELFFNDVRVPVENVLGAEHEGFGYLMHELAQERMIIAIRAATSIETLLDETIAYTRQRKAFGQAVFDYQNTRFKLAQAKAEATMLRVFVEDCLEQLVRKELSPDRAAMAKLLGSEMQGRLLDEFVQLHGGYGFMSEYKVARAWVDARIARIYGGTSEVMREIIARTL